VYLNEAIQRLREHKKQEPVTEPELREAVYKGSVLRVRPKLMTVLADMIGLMPLLLATGVGSDVMRPITIPFVFGLLTSTLYVLIVLPVIYLWVKERERRKTGTVQYLKN